MLKRFDGSNFADVSAIKKFDGSSFVDVENGKRFDGANWVDFWNLPANFTYWYSSNLVPNYTFSLLSPNRLSAIITKKEISSPGIFAFICSDLKVPYNSNITINVRVKSTMLAYLYLGIITQDQSSLINNSSEASTSDSIMTFTATNNKDSKTKYPYFAINKSSSNLNTITVEIQIDSIILDGVTYYPKFSL